LEKELDAETADIKVHEPRNMFKTERIKQRNYKCHETDNLLKKPGHSVIRLSLHHP
jgi:hypothetical protein